MDFLFERQEIIGEWILGVVQSEKSDIANINFIFCSDSYLLDINKKYLKHDFLTDIISFPYSENPIEGDIYISIDRVKENAGKFSTPFENELYRVIIHGVLHFCGYKDKTGEEKTIMRRKEDEALKKLGETINGI